jgi:hypothetical protein
VPRSGWMHGVDSEQLLGMPGSPAWYPTASPNTIAQHMKQRCVAYGFRKGTSQMAQCVQQEAMNGRQMASARMRAIGEAMQASQPRMVSTTCNKFGNMVNCTTF